MLFCKSENLIGLIPQNFDLKWGVGGVWSHQLPSRLHCHQDEVIALGLPVRLVNPSGNCNEEQATFLSQPCYLQRVLRCFDLNLVSES